ncbi:VOC family protein [Bradyrhizobium lablabi]|uniref:VOC family protein n=1 Tax=Bradyrhizobium lablabi TaxID=722472 RepID=UPI001BA5A4D5|nr:VOC family protein [Bradyrhizobium lablabi]MBR0692035.1 VOC family protein [Bradyrhizobium lablabi]
MTGQVTHFEIYGEDPAGLAEFYASLFGWQIVKAPGVGYWRIQTGPKRGNGFDAGLTYRPTTGPHCWLNYVTVDSMDAALMQAQRMGASIVRPKTAVPRTGWCSVLQDPQGNSFAIWQADPTAFPPPEPD